MYIYVNEWKYIDQCVVILVIMTCFLGVIYWYYSLSLQFKLKIK